MCVKHLLIFFVISFASRGHSYENGYSLETCDDLKPNREANEPNITSTHSGSPFEIVISSKYRRNRVLEVVIRDNAIEGFQLQFRKFDRENKRVGEFVEWPEGTKILPCDGKNTSVTHVDLKPKANLTFKWRSPEECVDTIKLYDAYVSKQGYYWNDVSEDKLTCGDLPISIKGCGKNISCVRYSPDEKDCDGNTCSYLITHEIHRNEISFTLNALSDDPNSYSAVGFSEKEDGKVNLIACVRENGKVFIKHYVRNDEKQPLMEETVNIEKETTDQEDDNFWCAFTLPFKDAGPEPFDFSKNLYWIYAWGKMNQTSHLPILGKEGNAWHKSQRNSTELLNEITYTDGSASMSVTGLMLVSLPLMLLTISQL